VSASLYGFDRVMSEMRDKRDDAIQLAHAAPLMLSTLKDLRLILKHKNFEPHFLFAIDAAIFAATGKPGEQK
jgi:hypothetical protein